MSDPTTDKDREAMRAMFPPASLPPDGEKITHGRHCICSACAAEDWTNPNLAPCGMHGSSCPREYAPLGPAGRAAATPDPPGLPKGEKCPTCGLTRWEEKQIAGWLDAARAASPDERLREADRAALVESIAQTERFRGGPCLCSDCVEKRADAEATVDAVLAALAATDRDKQEGER